MGEAVEYLVAVVFNRGLGECIELGAVPWGDPAGESSVYMAAAQWAADVGGDVVVQVGRFAFDADAFHAWYGAAGSVMHAVERWLEGQADLEQLGLVQLPTIGRGV